MTKPPRAFAGVFALVLALACASKPAAPTGAVAGIAVDRSGHGLPGITVTIQTSAGKVIDTVVTGADGSFLFPAVPAGSYQVLTLLRGWTTPSPQTASVVANQSTQLPPLLLLAPGLDSGSIELVTPTPNSP